ncbi:MAG: hypothetical protein IJO13_07610 [Lachnospiraceae bacterium]|nr:hypothetical protein [Lachnospiraceae bacterium]
MEKVLEKYSKVELLEEAECVEKYGEWIHLDLMGYSAEELRKAAYSKMPKIRKCIGNGQGSCKRCSDNGKWNRHWMCFLFEIEGMDGCYCSECIREIEKE